jgi:hypothetical protein
MAQVCTNSPLPTFDSLYSQVSPSLTNYKFTMPSLPVLPSPMMPNVSCPNIEMVTTISQLQITQYMNTCMAMLTPLTSYLGQSISAVIPAVPVLNVQLPALLSGSPSSLLASIQSSLASGFTFPGIPSPLFPDMQFPEFGNVMTLINVIKAYIMGIPAAIFSLVGQVTSALKIGAMSAIPAMPSLATLEGLVTSQLSGVTSYIEAMKQGLATSSIFNISVPGFPPIPSLPSPLFPSINFPEGEFYLGFGNMIDSLTIANLQPLYNFCENTLGSHLSFTFPTQCITFQ